MPSGELHNCKKCGTLFFKTSERDICDECFRKELEVVEQIKGFVNSAQKNVSLQDIADELNISLADLEDMVSRGRLFVALPKISIKCRFCGVELADDEKTGFTCKKCLTKFSPKLSELEKKGANKGSFEEEAKSLNRRLRGGMNTVDSEKRYGFIQNYDL